MPKMEVASITQQIGLDRITDTGNIREQEKYGPDEKGNFPEATKELAESIKKNGLLEPVLVKPSEIKDGIQYFELVAGFRRRAALQYLCNQKQDFNTIEAKIVTGDKLTIQLIENIQRADLTALERERAVFQMSENGIRQNDIGAQLSKSKSWVSIHISAYKMRVIANNNGIKTEGIETSTLSELLSIPDVDLPGVLKELVNFGGTRQAAKGLARAYDEKKNPALNLDDNLDISMDPAPGGEGEAPAESSPPPATGAADNETTPAPVPAESTPPPPAPENEKKQDDPPAPPPRHSVPPAFDPIEAEHAQVDVNIILTGIYDYIDGIKKILPDKKGLESMTEKAKIEAASDIIALIHERLENA